MADPPQRPAEGPFPLAMYVQYHSSIFPLFPSVPIAVEVENLGAGIVTFYYERKWAAGRSDRAPCYYQVS